MNFCPPLLSNWKVCSFVSGGSRFDNESGTHDIEAAVD